MVSSSWYNFVAKRDVFWPGTIILAFPDAKFDPNVVIKLNSG